MNAQFTGIIKCLPDSWVKQSGGLKYIRSIKPGIDVGMRNWWMSFPTRPRLTVLYLYVAFGGAVQFRVNIAEFQENLGPIRMSYGTEFTARFWAICTGPMVIPGGLVPMKGFRGYRYTEDLW